MASGPIISWQINGETMETVTDLIFLGSKITPLFLPEQSHGQRSLAFSKDVTEESDTT